MKKGKEKAIPSASQCCEQHNEGHLHETPTEDNREQQGVGSICCPKCNHKFEPTPKILVHLFNKFVGKFEGVKFEPSDQQLIEHLEAKINRAGDLKPDLLMDEFIATIQGDRGICYTHPERLPGVTKDGTSRHFFHKSSKAYKTGTRKRRKIQNDIHCDFPETRWHKTGKTKPVVCNGVQKGCKKILVLYTDYGKSEKAAKTNWVMHQYHLGGLDDENDGQFVVSKIFYQTQPRQPSEGRKNHVSYESREIGSNSKVPSEQRVQLVAREPIGYMQMPPHLNIQEPPSQISPLPAFHLNVPQPPPQVSPMVPFHLNMPNQSYTPGSMAPPIHENILANTYQQNMLATSSYQLEQEQQFHGDAAAHLEEIMRRCTSSVPKEGTTNAHSNSDWGFFNNWTANNAQDPPRNP